MKIKFNKVYFLFFTILVATETGVLFTKGFIRHTVGDFLVVITLYCLLMSFIKIDFLKAAITILIFSFAIEFIQLTNFLHYFDLEKSAIAKIIFGNTFSLQDILAYTLGIGLVVLIESKRKRD